MPEQLDKEGRYSLQDIFETLGSTLRFEEVLDRILEVTLRELMADQGSLLLLEGESLSLKMLSARGLPEEIIRRGYVQRKGSISEYVLREQRPLIVNSELKTNEYETMSASTSTPRSIHSALCVPLVARGQVLGTMNINRTTQRQQFSEQDMETGVIIASQAAIVIHSWQLQEELLQQQRLAAIGQTVAGISHCIKNILAGVRGGLGLTEMGLEANNMNLINEGYGLLKRNAGTLTNLVLDLLDYAKEREPMRASFAVTPMINHIINTVDFKANDVGVRLEKDIREEIVFYGDHDQITRALLNLVTNAIEACGEAPRSGMKPLVIIRVEKVLNSQICSDISSDGNCMLIEVIDNGPGIPEDTQHLIWDLFYSTKGTKGTGIGLATTKKMIEEHGGKLGLISSMESGTTFQVFLPFTD